ncbi:MAG: TldD protein [Kiritimatiellia bacterium]|jgi:TldD protein
MSRPLFRLAPCLFGLTLSLSVPSHADELQQVLEGALTQHTQELKLGKNAPEIYHLRYHVMSMEQVDIVASQGFIVTQNTSPYRMLSVELRVGEPMYDNTGFGGWENGFGFSWLPQVVTPHATKMALWRMTDEAYKQAIEQYSRKKAQFKAPKDYPGDYTLADAVVHEDGPPPKLDQEGLTTLAKRLSSAFAGTPGLVRGEVHIGQEAGYHLIVDTGGHRVRRSVGETSVRALLHVRTADGMLLTDSRLWTVRSSTDLAETDDLLERVNTMKRELLATAAAPVLEQEYVGPVVFHDSASVDLFRQLLLPQLEGTPAEVPFDSFFGELGSGPRGVVRIGRRVLPVGWNVSDDPGAQPQHPGAFTHDWEGTPAKSVNLVVDGIVRDVLMSRVPRQGRSESNGHARGSLRQRLSGRPVATTVTPSRPTTRNKLHKRAVKLAQAYGRDWYLRVERLQEPAVRSLGTNEYGDDSDMAMPVRMFKVRSDGSEQVVRGARFASVQRFALRDIIAAGPQTQASFMIPSDPGGGLYSPTGGLPTWMSAPEILVGELEVVPAPGDPNDSPVLPHPNGAMP